MHRGCIESAPFGEHFEDPTLVPKGSETDNGEWCVEEARRKVGCPTNSWSAFAGLKRHSMFEKQRGRIAGPVYPSAVAWTLKFVGEADRKSSVSNRPPVASRRRSMLLLFLSLPPVQFYADLSFVSFLPFYFLPCSKIRSRRRRRRRETCIYIARRKEQIYEGMKKRRRVMKERRFDRWKRSTITMVTRFLELTWSKLLLGTRLAAIKAFQRRPSVRMTTSSDPENKPLVSNLSRIWSPVAGRGYEPSSIDHDYVY